MQALLYTVFAWFAAKLAVSILARIFSYFVVGYISTSIVTTIIDTVYASLNAFPGLQILLLAGVGEAVSIVGSAILFRVTLIPVIYKPVPDGSAGQ